jgi:hypothetical protein
MLHTGHFLLWLLIVFPDPLRAGIYHEALEKDSKFLVLLLLEA